MNPRDGHSLGGDDLEVTAAGHWLRARRLSPSAGSAPDAPTLVFLHEGLGSIAMWKGFPAALVEATGLPGLVYERWGFGGSAPLVLPRPVDYMAEEAEVALPELLAACGVARPLLVGHSDGGTIALLYAAAFPDKPVACITEAAHVFVEEETLAGIREAEEAWRTTDLPARLARYHGDRAETVFRGWTETWLRADFRDWSMTARLPAITCPLLVIQGADDHYGTEAQVAAIVDGSAGPATPLILPACAHSPHAEQADVVLAAMAGFVGDVLAAG